jgi:hypothetical protein
MRLTIAGSFFSNSHPEFELDMAVRQVATSESGRRRLLNEAEIRT